MLRRYPELLVIALLFTIALIHVVHYELSHTEANLAKNLIDGELSMAQTKAIDTILEVSHLMFGWAVAIIGAIAFFFRLNVEAAISLKRADLVTTSIIVILSVVSLYYGHLGTYKVAEMLSLNQFPIGDSHTKEIFGRQYLTALGATGLFGFHVTLLCWRLIRR